MRFPVSFAQQRLWFLEQLTPGEPTYNMPYAFWLEGPLDAHALQRAMDAVVARHAVLRTSIVGCDGVPEQVVADTGTVPIEHIEVPPGLDECERTRKAESIAGELARQPFDLATAPLIRTALIVAGPDLHLFVLVMHHSISDCSSVEILIDELSDVYRAETTGVPASLPPLLMEYGDYAVWQQDRMQGEELDRQLSYWREQLRGAPQLLTLPTDRPRPIRQSTRGGVATIYVDAATTQRLAAVAYGANSTMFMVFLTGFAATLSRYTRQADMLLGTQVASRTYAELDPIVGMFTNTLTLRMSLAGDPTFAELLGRVRDTTADALAHEQLPFEKLVADFAPDRTLAHTPLIQVQFVYGSLTPPTLDLPGITARSLALLTSTAKLDLIVYADAQDAQVTRLSMEYSTDLFDTAWADRFLGCMATLLEHAADAPGTPVADLPMLSAAQRDELIIERNRQGPPGDDAADGGDAHSAPDDSDADVWWLLQASTSRVIDGDRSLSMSEVCDRAARIARALADHGVSVETTVGVFLDRGIDMLTALLGIWWAGGAYVPLDPGFPQARLAAMARGAGLRIIICDAAHHDLALSGADGPVVIRIDDPQTAAGPPLAPVPVRVYILDERLMPVPVGVVGEVCVGGRGVTRGYHDQPQLTARAFRPDPWSNEPGARLYRTGDLGRWREDGNLQLTGRSDHQVKIRGWSAASSAAGRVEPRNPVEATLAQIWGDLLDTQAPVGVHDNLFALGGHSLTATRFVARLGDTYGVELPVHQVFASPTIAELAEVIAAYPDFRVTKSSSRHAELDALSDDDLDALLRAALAQRNRRRAIADGSDS
jgi:non-ribosomal peptide synthetase component F